ncbi:BRCA1-associated RING domain protein 1-like [Mytilus galloprovincialis]|uniref:BRCA1-associated RING domain protein 1-like n=1 Tax=Mytilus galloprovincialis TaxID=29158 RepID=UPI003F7BF848
MTSTEFPETFEALKDLQNLLKCKSCGKLAESPCTLGGCEHIFCNTCCDINLEKNECPLCNVHVNVKAAQVNRQIYNVVRLCQRLEAVLTDTDNNSHVQTQKPESHSDLICETETIAGNIGSYRSPRNRINSKKVDKGVDHTSMKNKKEQLDVSLNDHERETQSSKDRRKRRSVPADQRTMTQMLLESDQEREEEEMSLSEEEEQTSPKNKKTRRIKGNKLLKSGTNYPIDQTTMSQYFDYTDVEDGSFDGVQDGKMETMIKNETTKTSDKKKKLHKNQTRNLRTRSKGMKVNSSDTETPSPIGKPSRRHSLGAVTNRVQELRDEHAMTTADKKARRSLSPNKPSNIKSRSHSPKQQCSDPSINLSPQQQGKRKSKDKLNTSVTGSGKKNVDPLLKKNAKGETPLQVAAIKGDIKRIEELLKAGALPNARDNAGWTPLHEAVHYGHTEIAKKLLDHGAMINVPGTENDTPLHDALRQGQLDCVRLLVSYGACLTSRNIHGLTPVDFAVTEDMKAALSTDITTTAGKTTEVVDVLEYQQPCLLHTALSREQKILLQKCATVIQGRVVEDFCPEVTHIVTSCNKEGMCARTFKYMHGVVNGKWIVNFEWVNMCLEFGHKVCEEAFEIPGSSQNIESHAAEKGRINRKNQQPKLFDGYQFYFSGNFEYPTPQKEDLIELVKSGGGQILTREPKLDHIPKIPTVPYHAPNTGPLSKCYIFVVHDNNSHNELIRKEKIGSVSVAWILDCIGLFQIKQNVEI